MAYRQFRNEATYEAPQFDGMPRTLAALDTANRIKAQRAHQDRTLQDSIYQSKDKGSFIDTNTKINNLIGLGVEATKLWKQSGRQGLPDEVRDIMAKTNALAKRDKVAFDSLQKIEENLRSDNDPYTRKGDALNDLSQLYGKDIDSIEKDLSSFNAKEDPKYFNNPKFLTDFVKRFGDKQTESSNKSASGIKYSNDYKGVFFDKDGNPGIDNSVVEQALSEDPRVDKYYTNEILKDLNSDYKKIIAAGLQEIPATKEGDTLRALIQNGDDNAAINYLRENPEINPIDQRTEFKRKADKIIPELKDREAVQIKRESDLSGKLPNSQWGSGNKNANDAADGVFNGTPGRVVTLGASNKLPILQATTAKVRRNIDTGEINYTGSANVPMTINYYSWGAVGKDGAPYKFNNNNIEETKRSIAALPAAERAEMVAKPIMFGNSIDKASVLNLAYSQGRIAKLQEEARKQPDGDTAAEINPLQESLSKMAAGEEYDTQLIQKYFGTDVVRNEMFAVDKNDPNETQYDAMTGIRVYDPKSMNPQMKEMKSFIEEQAKLGKQELIQEGAEFKQKMESITKRNEEKVTGKSTKHKETTKVSTQADVDKLPKGTKFIWSDGVEYVKE